MANNMPMKPIIVKRIRCWRYVGIDEAAKRLGVSRAALHAHLRTNPKAIGPEKRKLLKVVTVGEDVDRS